MRVVKYIALIFTALMFIESTCAAATPVRIARLPIIHNNVKISQSAYNDLEIKIARAVHIPLNGTLKLAEYISVDESAAAFNEIYQKFYAKKMTSQIVVDAVKILSDELDADIVVCPIIQRYSEFTMPSSSLRGDTRLYSEVKAELIIYDRRTDDLVDKNKNRQYNGSYNKFGTAAQLAGECFDNLIKETELRQIIRDIK